MTNIVWLYLFCLLDYSIDESVWYGNIFPLEEMDAQKCTQDTSEKNGDVNQEPSDKIETEKYNKWSMISLSILFFHREPPVHTDNTTQKILKTNSIKFLVISHEYFVRSKSNFYQI